MMKTKLESENIICFLFDENIVGLNPLYSITVGGIKLKVNKSDIDRAAEIIEGLNNSPTTNDKGEILKCSNCKSDQLYRGYKSMKGVKGIFSIIISFLLVVFPIYFNTVYKCKKCGHEFKY